MRVVFNGVDDLAQIIPDLTEEEKKTHDFGSYTAEHYYDDMGRITQYRTDPDLCEILISRSFETIVWMRKKGVKFQASYGRQSYKVDDGKRYKFWGGLAAETWGGGAGLVDNEHKACEREGIKIFYETPAHRPDHQRRRRRARRAREAQGQERRDPLEGGGARLRRLRVRAPRCARATSARAGTSPRCAAPATTPASASRWRSTSAPCPTATGRAATRWAGT